MNEVRLPKIQSTRASDIGSIALLHPPSRLERIRRNENADPIVSGASPQIYMSKDLMTPKSNLVPIIEKYNNANNNNH
jgi:hypothetical protein